MRRPANGRRPITVVSFPGSEVTSSFPLWGCRIHWATLKPRPQPSTYTAVAGVASEEALADPRRSVARTKDDQSRNYAAAIPNQLATEGAGVAVQSWAALPNRGSRIKICGGFFRNSSLVRTSYFDAGFWAAKGQVPFALRGPVPSRNPLPHPRVAPLPWLPQAGQFVRDPPFGQTPPFFSMHAACRAARSCCVLGGPP